jgi:hypothetical protein
VHETCSISVNGTLSLIQGIVLIFVPLFIDRTAIGADETHIETSFHEAIRIAQEQKSIALGKRAEGTYEEYRRQKVNASEGRGFRLPLWRRAGLWLYRLSGARDRGAHQSQVSKFSKVFVKSA